MEPGSAQLTAAVLSLINALIAKQRNQRGLVSWAYASSFARWGLNGYVLAEANRLQVRWQLGNNRGRAPP
jgi:hypothetical protein